MHGTIASLPPSIIFGGELVAGRMDPNNWGVVWAVERSREEATYYYAIPFHCCRGVFLKSLVRVHMLDACIARGQRPRNTQVFAQRGIVHGITMIALMSSTFAVNQRYTANDYFQSLCDLVSPRCTAAA